MGKIIAGNAFELLVKQERRHLPNGNLTKIVESMLDVIKNAHPNTESLFSLTFRDEMDEEQATSCLTTRLMLKNYSLINQVPAAKQITVR